MKKAIITDVKYRMTLPAIRCLAKHNIFVTACEYADTSKDKALGMYSKYVGERLYVKNLIDDLIAYAKKQDQKPVLIPFGAKTLSCVCENYDLLSKYMDLCVPKPDKLLFANDKQKVTEFAQALGIKVPKNYNISSLADIEKADIIYPCVVKYRNGEALGLAPNKRYKIINNRPELLHFYEKMSALQPFPLVQEYISGEGKGVSFVFDKNHKAVSGFCHRRLREYPVSGGPSCLCESIWDEKLYKNALKLMESIGWSGVAMVEFKGDTLMEINPRFWGSSGLSCLCGADSVYHLYNASCGIEYDKTDTSYKRGKKMRFLIQDLLSFSTYLKKADNKLKFIFSFIFCDLLNPKISDGVLSFRDFRASSAYLKSALSKGKQVL